MINVKAVALAWILCGIAATNTVAQSCNDSCGGLPTSSLLAYSRLIGNPIKVAYTNAQVWFDPSWTAYHLFPSLDAWEAGTFPLQLEFGADPHVLIWFVDTNYLWGTDLANTYPNGSPWGWQSGTQIYVNVEDYGPLYWFTGPDPADDTDLRTVLIHELGHALGLGDTPQEGFETCTVMTPTYSGVERSIRSLDQAAINCYYAALPVGDIWAFSVQGSAHNVNLSFEIREGANPNEYAAVYVSDNPAGPARLIDVLTDHANVMPIANSWEDSYRLPPAMSYYYWLDYTLSPGVDVLRSPESLYPSATYANVTGTAYMAFDAPNILAAADVPFDLGGKVLVTWEPSADEASIDYYNLYRNSYPPGEPGQAEWKYVTSLNTGVTSFLDEFVITGWVNQYKVSAAHHGNYTLQAGRGNRGIWNEMSEVVSGPAVNNFATDQITLVSNDTLTVCPNADAETLQAEVIIWGSQIGPTVGIPPEMLECYPQGQFAHFCQGEPLIVDGPTDATGRTTLTTAAIGGHERCDLVFALANSYLRFDTLTVFLKSPDANGDGLVGVVDFADFASGGYPSPPNPYRWRYDFNVDGINNVTDYGFLAVHYDHECSGGGQASSRNEVTSGATIQVRLTEVVYAGESRVLHADVSATGLLPFKALVFHLRTDNPTLDFERWERGGFQGRILVAPIVRDGVGEIAVGVLDGENLEGSTIELGRLVFRIESRDVLQLGERDFETRVAETLSPDGVVSRMSTASSGETRPVQRVVGDALAQNRPNPFNPTTIITYSISQPGHVELLVFGVDGSLGCGCIIGATRDASTHKNGVEVYQERISNEDAR